MSNRNFVQICSLVAAITTLGLLAITGCGNKESSSSSSPSGGSAGAGGPGGSGGPGGMRGPGGPGGPISATATGDEIYQKKCGCHGPGGSGGKAPQLKGTGKSDEQLIKVIHDGDSKMPAFSGQLSDDQIKSVAGAVKKF